MAKTLLLDNDDWDLVVDAKGNIAVAAEPYSLAQDAASAIRLFRGEQFYDTTLGVPYFQSVLGRNPPLALLKQLMVDAALSVPGVVSAVCYITAVTDRGASGQIQVRDAAGNTGAASF